MKTAFDLKRELNVCIYDYIRSNNTKGEHVRWRTATTTLQIVRDAKILEMFFSFIFESLFFVQKALQIGEWLFCHRKVPWWL